VILPLLDGYDGGDTVFTSIADQAQKIAVYLTEHHADRLYAAVGMSMGGFISLELFSRTKVHTEKLVLDSGYLCRMPFPKIVASVVSNGFYAIMHGSKSKIIRRSMLNMMGYCFRREDLYPASKQTIYNSEYTCLTYRLPENLKDIHAADIAYWYGSKEPYMIKGMKVLKQILPTMKLKCTGDVGHSEIMLEQPEQYGRNILSAIIEK
jgi:pimeloyl-ACP methyl ester carboxylesterase